MKIRSVVSVRQTSACQRAKVCAFSQGAFTFTEMMVSLAILLVVSTGIISSHYFGLRMYEITRTRLGVSDATRNGFNQLTEEIRNAKAIQIGQGTLTTFTESGMNTLQQGNAVQIYPSTDKAIFIRYFRDAKDQNIKRVTDNFADISVLAQSVSNAVVFTCEDFSGNVLTNRQSSFAVGIRFQFGALPDTQVPVGPGNYYDSYQWQTRITRRAGE